jgi:glycosyltransferase involved in cell wall biosynthesis
MRVALLNPVFWPEVRRGSERFARELADRLLARGHDPRLIVGHAGARTRAATEDGLPVVRVPRLPEGRLRRRLFEDHLTHVPFAEMALRRGDDDVAHALHHTDAVAAARWKRRSGRPVVFSYMGIPHRQALANRRLRVETMRRALAGADAVVALSETAARGFERWLGVEARVIHPGVDLGAFAPEPAARAAEPTILCAADASQPRKRVRLLVDAFAHVRAQHPQARLVLSAPRAFDTPPGVEWRDLDDRAALAAANREAHVAVLPSIGEAFGLVLVEALACGTPVVGADREAIPEVLGGDERLGRLFAGEDPRALAAALVEALALVHDPATAVHCRARAEHFSWERTADAYVDLYREVGAC